MPTFNNGIVSIKGNTRKVRANMNKRISRKKPPLAPYVEKRNRSERKYVHEVNRDHIQIGNTKYTVPDLRNMTSEEYRTLLESIPRAVERNLVNDFFTSRINAYTSLHANAYKPPPRIRILKNKINNLNLPQPSRRGLPPALPLFPPTPPTPPFQIKNGFVYIGKTKYTKEKILENPEEILNQIESPENQIKVIEFIGLA